MDKKIPVWILALVVFIGLNLAVVFGWFVRHASEGREKLGVLGPVVMEIANFPTLVQYAFIDIAGRSPMLIDNRFPGIDGFKINGVLQDNAAKDDGYLLLSAYDDTRKQSTVKLIRIRDGQILHEWVPNIRQLAGRQKTESVFLNMNEMTARRYRIMHPLLIDDGGLIFHGERSPLFKVNVCSNFEWVVDGVFHHSLQQGPDGSYWVPAYVEPAPGDVAKSLQFDDEAIVQVSADGKLLFRKAVSSILVENGYRGLLYGIRLFGPRVMDLNAINLNDIQPAHYSTRYWEKGDLLLSIRNLSTVLVYRPSTNKIIWLKTGPWLNQHDPDFVGQSKISVLGNDMVRKVDDSQILLDGQNNIYVFDFAEESIASPYSSVLRELKLRSVVEGQQDILENGDAFVEEYGSGRLLRMSPTELVWQFVVKVDERTVGMVSWSRYLTAEQVNNVLPRLANANCP